jgi:hypothetical protein
MPAISESTKELRCLRGYWQAMVVMRESEPARCLMLHIFVESGNRPASTIVRPVGSEKKSSLICRKTGRTVTISTLHLECGSAATAFETKAAAALPHSKYFVRIRDIWTIFSDDRRDG